MRHLLPYLMFAALCVLQVAAAGNKWNRRSNFAGKFFREEDLAPPSPRLRQTTGKEIHDRQVSRTNPNYKRQMASSVPAVFPTCSVAYPGTISVARYAQVELNGPDVLPPGEYLAATSEMDCLRQCSLLSGCVGYFYRSDVGRRWPKASGWTASGFLFTSSAATATGSVTGLLGTCAAAATKGAPSAANNVCCNAQMATAITYPTCSAYRSGSITVARYPAVELNAGNSVIAPGPLTANSESECLGLCQKASDCVAYFYRADLSQCYPKARWLSPARLLTDSSSSRAPGAVVGILRTCTDVAASGAPDTVNSVCCDAKMGQSSITYPTCSAYQSGGVTVARYPAVEINSGNSVVAPGPLTAESESECLGLCIKASDCVAYFFRADLFQCYPKARWLSPARILSDSSSSRAYGAVSGILTTCSDVDALGAPDTVNSVCCDAKLTPCQ